MIAELVVYSLVAFIVGAACIAYLVGLTSIKKREKMRLAVLFVFSYGFIVMFAAASYYLASKDHAEKTGKRLSFIDYINGGLVDTTFLKRILVGLGTGVVFGIIDNAGLWFGMDALDPILPRGKLTQAGLGNVFSDTLSAFLSTFAGNIIQHLTGVKGGTPIWSDAVGTFVGCLSGLFGSRLLTGRT